MPTGHAGHMPRGPDRHGNPIDYVSHFHSDVITICVELQEICFKTATFSLLSVAKCVELQEINFKTYNSLFTATQMFAARWGAP